MAKIDRIKGSINVPAVRTLPGHLGQGPGLATVKAGEGMASMGNEIYNAAIKANEQFFAQAKQARQAGTYADAYNKAILGYSEQASPILLNPVDEDGAPLLDRLPKRLGDIGQNVLKDVLSSVDDPEVKEKLARSFNNYLTNQQIGSYSKARQQQIDYTRSSINGTIDTLYNAATNDRIDNAGAHDLVVKDLLDSSGGAFSEQEKQQIMSDYKEKTRISMVSNMLKQDPQGTLKMLESLTPEDLGVNSNVKDMLENKARAGIRDAETQALKQDKELAAQHKAQQSALEDKLELGITLGHVQEKDLFDYKDKLADSQFNSLIKKVRTANKKSIERADLYNNISNDIIEGEFLTGKYTNKQINDHYQASIQQIVQANEGKKPNLQAKAGIVKHYKSEVTAFTTELENALKHGTGKAAEDAVRAIQYLSETGSDFTALGMDSKSKAVYSMVKSLMNNTNVSDGSSGISINQIVELAQSRVLDTPSEMLKERQADISKEQAFKSSNIEKTVKGVLEKIDIEDYDKLQDGIIPQVEFLIKEGYIATGNVQAAQEYASTFIKGIYGTSEMSGTPTAMILPPEQVLQATAPEIQEFLANSIDLDNTTNVPLNEDGSINSGAIHMENAGIDSRDANGQVQYFLVNSENNQPILLGTSPYLYKADPKEVRQYHDTKARDAALQELETRRDMFEKVEKGRMSEEGRQQFIKEFEPGAPVKGIKSPEVQGALEKGSSVSGVDTKDLAAIAKVESALNPRAKARTSSASGLFQFIDGTWRGMVRKYGKQYGISMGDRFNPEANAIMGALFTRDNINTLKRSLGRQPDIREVYLAHFSGVGKAIKVIKALENNPNAHVSTVYSQAEIRANRGILQGSLQNAFRRLTDKVVRARNSFG